MSIYNMIFKVVCYIKLKLSVNIQYTNIAWTQQS